LRTRCKSLCAKGLDSCFSCHSDVDASKFASSQLESTSSIEHMSLWMVTSVLMLWIALP
jgi:hypothetical protein